MLQMLSDKISECTRCQELAETRTQTVFGEGNPNAKIFFLGEAPGADEDKQGKPFVGRAGKLLDEIIKACGWTREDVYIGNILKCRPPGNRNPTKEESDNCESFLKLQLRIINPKYIVCLGTTAAQNLLHTDERISRMRGKWRYYGDIKVLCTYHPSFLLRNPKAKKDVWDDLQILIKDINS